MAADHQPQSALYQTIHSQPEVVRAVLRDTQGASAAAADLLSGARRVFLTGTGTSGHAAIVGEHLLRLAGVDAYATTNFDFVTYPRAAGPDDALVTISHRGSKRYGARAIARAREAGMRVIGLTGQGSPMEGPDIIVETAPPERSSTHTASYTANLAALATIAVRLGEGRGVDAGALRDALTRLPEDIATVLAREALVVPAAEALAARGRLTLAGAGPNAATAREGALKIKESSYLTAEGVELETALHGHLQAIEAGDLAVVIAAQGPALERIGDLVRALELLGARVVVVADGRALSNPGFLPTASVDRTSARIVIPYPAVPEALSPILAVVPLQLLAAYTAARRGTDADSFRADNPIYKRVNESYTL